MPEPVGSLDGTWALSLHTGRPEMLRQFRGIRLAPATIGLLLPLVAGSLRAEEVRPAPLQDAYALRVGCAGAAAALVAQADANGPISEKQRADEEEALTNTRDEAFSSGSRIGVTDAQVTEAMDRRRDGISKRLAQVAGSPDRLAKETADLGQTVINCALVEEIERNKADGGAATHRSP